MDLHRHGCGQSLRWTFPQMTFRNVRWPGVGAAGREAGCPSDAFLFVFTSSLGQRAPSCFTGESSDLLGFPGGSDSEDSVFSVGDLGSIPGSGRSPGEGNGNPLQYSCLGNHMDRGAWWAAVHGIAKFHNFSDSACTHTGTRTHLCCRDGHSQLLISLTFPSFSQRLEACHSLFPERTSAVCRGGPSMAEAAFVAPGTLWPVQALRLPTCLLPPGWPGPARPFWGFGAHRNQALPCLLLPGPGWLRPEVPGSLALLGVHNLTSVIWSISLFRV